MGWKCVPRETAARWSDRFRFKHSLVHLRLRWSVVSLSGSNSKRPGGGRQIPDGYTPKAFLNELTDSLQLPLNITCMFYEWDQTNWLLENKSSSQDSTIMAPEKKKKARHYGYLAMHISPNLFYILKGGGSKAWENIEAFISLANTSDQKAEVMFWCFIIQKAINAEALL